MKKISKVANQIGATTANLVQQKSQAQDHSFLDAKINLKEVTNGLGVQFDQFLRVVVCPGPKPTILEDSGFRLEIYCMKLMEMKFTHHFTKH